MKPFNFWRLDRTTFEGYIRTRREDWFYAAEQIANQLNGKKRILDIGSGDGHSTRQILAQTKGDYTCDLIEPDKEALSRSIRILKECNIGNTYPLLLADFLSKQKSQAYDAIYAIHTNYYWGAKKPSCQRQSRKRYHGCLEGLLELTPNLLILTSSINSDYNLVVKKSPFPEWVSSEYLSDFYKKKKKDLEVTEIPCNMRFYVGDIFKDRIAATEVWKFFNNTEREPKKSELKRFLDKMHEIEIQGYINFRDVLIIAKKQNLVE